MNQLKMNRLEIARSGNLRALSGLIHERDPSVINTMLQNPNISSRLLIQLIRNNSLDEKQILTITGNRSWLKDYNLKLELLLYSKTPRHISLKLLQDMMLRDLALISRRVTIHPTLRELAVNYLKVRLEAMRLGEKIMLARTGPIAFLPSLMSERDARVFNSALQNFRLAEDDLMIFCAPSMCSAEKLDLILTSTRWGSNPRLLGLLATHKNLSYASRRRVFQKINLTLLLELTASPVLDENHRSLAKFTARERIRALPLRDKLQLAGSPSKRVLFFLGTVMQDPGVVETWLKNPRVDERLRDRIIRKNRSPVLQNQVGHTKAARSRAVADDSGGNDFNDRECS